jgi:hypothetical protein
MYIFACILNASLCSFLWICISFWNNWQNIHILLRNSHMTQMCRPQKSCNFAIQLPINFQSGVTDIPLIYPGETEESFTFLFQISFEILKHAKYIWHKFVFCKFSPHEIVPFTVLAGVINLSFRNDRVLNFLSSNIILIEFNRVIIVSPYFPCTLVCLYKNLRNFTVSIAVHRWLIWKAKIVSFQDKCTILQSGTSSVR